jgi:predicted transcriptional regulator
MSITALNLSDELKRRVVDAAQELGISPHTFMVDAIRQATNAVERRVAFAAATRDARAEMLEKGQGYAPDEVWRYIRDRVESAAADKPTKKSWRE